MSDDSKNDTSDPLQCDEVMAEAFEVSDDEAVSESEEGANVEALSRSFESYVRNYQDTWQQAWQESIDAYEQDVADWQTMVANFQNNVTLPQAQPKTTASASTSAKTPSATKAKSSKAKS